MTPRVQRCVLRINLTTGEITREPIPEDYIEMFLGGRVLGDMYLYNELNAGIDPLSPENKLMFGIGPLTGTSVTGSSRYIVHTKSPLTGIYLNSLAGGYFGPAMRKAACDQIIIEGRSEKPIYVLISDDEVELRDARSLWGMTTGDVQEFIKKELKDEKIRIACIGPAGENLVLYASIISERRAAGRGGAGAVMGSKNLKAIAVRGTGKAIVADPEAFRLATRLAIKEIANNPTISELFPLYGSQLAMPLLNEGGVTPWNNWQDSSYPGAESLFAVNWRKGFVKKDVRCAPPCNVMCSKISLVTDGPYAGALTEGPDYEAEYSLGACCGITDQAAVILADELCDKYGLDTISMGVSLAFAMECYEKGIIGIADTRGEEIKFGQAHLLPKIIHDTAYQIGFGALLSKGTKRMAEIFGKGSEAFAMHAKGLELGGYDPRGAKSVALVFACGPRGGCHKSGGSGNALSCKEIPTGEARFLTSGKAAMAKASRENRVLADSAILCIFPQAGYSDATLAELLSAATGFTFNSADMYTIGERGSNIERAFNVREGLRRSWDTLPRRLLTESVRSGPSIGQVVELDTLLDDFYRLCGWDSETGIPTHKKLTELELGSISKDMEVFRGGESNFKD